MEKQNNPSSAAGHFRYSLKKLFTIWLPILFVLSIIISIVYIFKFEDVSYLNSSFSVGTGNLWGNIFSVFFTAIGASEGLVIAILVCSLILFLFVEVFSIIRLVKLRKIEQSGILKMLLRFFAAQVITVGVASLGFILIAVASLGVSFVSAYADLRMNVKEALHDAISDDQEIIKNIRNSSSIIDVYDASDEAGAVLAKRDLKKKDKLTTYEGIVLPLLAKFKRKDPEGKSFFIPSTNSVVYTNFNKNRTENIIIELAFNHLKYHPNPIAVSSFKTYQKPVVAYLDDQAYAPFLKQKQNELNQKRVNDFRAIISANEKIVSTCTARDAANTKLVTGQESDYQKNCVGKTAYSNCAEFRQKIDKNTSVSREAADACRENKMTLAPQYKELEDMKADIEKEASSILENQKGELSSGIYVPEIHTIYMRVIPDQDAFVYLSTLLHELFHHYSKGGSDLPVFINEGLTDYITFKSFKLSDYEIADVSGYFKEAETVMALLEKIPEQEIMTAYFTDDPEMLEASFKKAFPDVDYKTFLSKGDTMYKETYEVISPTFNLGFWDTTIDHPAVRDMRIFLGLLPAKFYK